ncbi:hypothetical protein [Brevibacterium permense]|uniref:hypothetical protein n=1 Tax=Brevibacterium permense TaxID=234834 RepID=UPI0021CFCEE1|nr:hypothetical protein [Brevibacterium permense]
MNMMTAKMMSRTPRAFDHPLNDFEATLRMPSSPAAHRSHRAVRLGDDEKLTGRENLKLIARLQGLSRGAAQPIAADLLDEFGLE